MKLAVLILGLFVGVCVCLNCETEEYQDLAWEGWKGKFNKSYGFEEEELRKKIWANNMLYIKEFNAQGHSYTLGTNQFADLTNLEYRRTYLGYDNEARRNLDRKNVEVYERKMKDIDLPTEVDWRKKGVVTPVKNQGQCGSCWSFSATGSLEGQYAIKNGKLISFGEQQLVDCSTSFGNHGCQGGLMDYAFEYWKKDLEEKESDYPYKAVNGKCSYNAQLGVLNDISYTDVKSKDIAALKDAIANAGPISVAMDASHESFQLYHSGIYRPFFCSEIRLDHGVLVVGYGTLDGVDYWLVKNSWAETWGDNGYFKIETKSNKCGIATSASYPKV